MPRIEIKEEDIWITCYCKRDGVEINTKTQKEAERLKSQILSDHEIVNRLKEEMKIEQQHIKDNPRYQFGKCGLLLSKFQKILGVDKE